MHEIPENLGDIAILGTWGLNAEYDEVQGSYSEVFGASKLCLSAQWKVRTLGVFAHSH